MVPLKIDTKANPTTKAGTTFQSLKRDIKEAPKALIKVDFKLFIFQSISPREKIA
jgi:hypothetical protein